MNYWEIGTLLAAALWGVWTEWRLRATRAELREAILAKTDAQIERDVARLSDVDLKSELDKDLGAADPTKPTT